MTQEAKISSQVKFLEAHENNTIPYCRCKRKNSSNGVKSTLVIFVHLVVQGVKLFSLPMSTKLVHRRGWWILSIMRTGWFSSQVGSSEIRRSQQKQDHCNNHPGHQDHGNADAVITRGPWQFLKTFCVCAVGLGLPQQIDQPSHRMFMRANTFTGIESTFCHDYPA